MTGAPDTGPGAIPDPPREAPYRPIPIDDGPVYSGPTYTDPGYNTEPAINQSPAPRATTQPTPSPKIRPGGPVRPILPPKGYLRVGRFITKDTGPLSHAQVNSINRYAAYGEAKIAQSLIAVGVSPREADRQAASTIIGVVVGGGVGAATLGIPLAVVGGLGGAAIGAGIGALVPPTPFNAGPGALIGAGSGAVVLGLGGAAAGAGIGGTIGGVIGYILGAGDPRAHPTLPGHDPARPPAPLRKAAPLLNPGANRYQLTVGDEAGLPGRGKVSYVVETNGAVDLTATIGGRDFHVGLTKAQAEAPLKALGGAEAQARHAIDDATKRISDAANSLAGVHVEFPQFVAPRHAVNPRHSAAHR
ncbi:hypothetical protein [Williamsia sp.]|uniref:hypothetical protein n=1 Tax=Williamsia sp. TaxID=1872085 RepID=UPI0025F4117C|nr:hypothetical protein [Williamsia sp.]